MEGTGYYALYEGNILIAEAHDFGLFCNDILKIKPVPTSEVRRLIITFSRREIKPMKSSLQLNMGKDINSHRVY